MMPQNSGKNQKEKKNHFRNEDQTEGIEEQVNETFYTLSKIEPEKEEEFLNQEKKKKS